MNIKRVIDISRPIFKGMCVWPGDREVSINKVSEISKGHSCNLTSVSFVVHAGTHIDAPCHFIENSLDIGSLDLNKFCGWCKVYYIESNSVITDNELRGLDIGEGDAIFLKTLNSERELSEPFFKDFVHLDESAAKYLASKRIRCLGVDYLSIDGYGKEGHKVHNIILRDEIGVIEGLCLREVDEGEYLFSAMPLNIKGSDGSPTRAVIYDI